MPGRGRDEDVTRDPGTTWFSLTPWSLSVEADGRVHARPAPGFGESDEPYRRQPPAVGVRFERGKEIGAARLQFRVSEEP